MTTETLTKKIYSGWAMSSDAAAKAAINMEIYETIRDKAKMVYMGRGYATTKYAVMENPHNLSSLELALIADKGNLCFGYRKEGNIFIIYTD